MPATLPCHIRRRIYACHMGRRIQAASGRSRRVTPQPLACAFAANVGGGILRSEYRNISTRDPLSINTPPFEGGGYLHVISGEREREREREGGREEGGRERSLLTIKDN